MPKKDEGEETYLVGGGKMIEVAGAGAVAGASRTAAGRDRGTRVRGHVATAT